MKHLFLILLLCATFTPSLQAQENDALKTYLSISVPMRSGLALVDYQQYQIKHDSLFVIHQALFAKPEEYELLGAYPISQRDMAELDALLAQTDSLGHHSSLCMMMGWPRFHIHSKYEGKALDGFVANCYRSHIFVFVDWLNRVYPEGEAIHYDKAELIRQEQEALGELEVERKGKNERK